MASLPGSRKVIFAAHSPLKSPFVVGSHHLFREFQSQGHQVTHLVKPITVGHLGLLHRQNTRLRLALWLKALGGQKTRLQEVCPMSLPNIFGPLLQTAMHKPHSLPLTFPNIQSLGLNKPDWLIVDEPLFAGIEKILRPNILIYRPTDNYQAKGTSDLIKTKERMLALAADAWVVTAESLAAHLEALTEGAKRQTLVLENGVEYDHFAGPQAPPQIYAHLPRPRAVYMGALDRRFDFDGFSKLVASAPSMHFIVIGPARPLVRRRLQAPNVSILGEISYQLLPGYLKGADFGLLPLSDDPGNAARSPMKIYEYAAAGLPVLARATPEIVRRAEQFVFTYTGADDICERFAEIQTKGSALHAIARDRAKASDWQAKARDFSLFLHQLEKNKAPSSRFGSFH